MNELGVLGSSGSARSLATLLEGRPEIDALVVYIPAVLSLSLSAEFLPSNSCLSYVTCFLNGARFYPSPVSTLEIAFFLIFYFGIVDLTTNDFDFYIFCLFLSSICLFLSSNSLNSLFF